MAASKFETDLADAIKACTDALYRVDDHDHIGMVRLKARHAALQDVVKWYAASRRPVEDPDDDGTALTT